MIPVWELWQPERQKTLQFENCKFGFGGVRAAGVKLPPRLGPSLAPSCQGQWDESRFWGGLSTKCYVWKAIIRDSLHIQSFLMSPGPRPEWASCVFDNNRPSITSGQQPTTATGPPSYKLNFDKRLTRGRVAWENYSPIWNWSPIILSSGAFRLGLSEDTTDRRQLSVLDWNWRGVTSTGRRPSSLSAVGYLTAANELLPTQELHQAAARDHDHCCPWSLALSRCSLPLSPFLAVRRQCQWTLESIEETRHGRREQEIGDVSKRLH